MRVSPSFFPIDAIPNSPYTTRNNRVQEKKVKSVIASAVVPCVLLLALAGCSSTPPPIIPASTQAASVKITPTLPPAARTNPAPATSPTVTAVAELPLPTSTPAPPTPVIPPGLYVVYLNTIPDPPVRGTELTFFVGFANNTSNVQTFRWIVYIYKADNLARSFGETTVTSTSAPPGAEQARSLGYWKLPLGGPCESYIARVDLLDQDNHPAEFKQPNGQLFQKDLLVCPP